MESLNSRRISNSQQAVELIRIQNGYNIPSLVKLAQSEAAVRLDYYSLEHLLPFHLSMKEEKEELGDHSTNSRTQMYRKSVCLNPPFFFSDYCIFGVVSPSRNQSFQMSLFTTTRPQSKRGRSPNGTLSIESLEKAKQDLVKDDAGPGGEFFSIPPAPYSRKLSFLFPCDRGRILATGKYLSPLWASLTA
jgi:hypothetical protein